MDLFCPWWTWSFKLSSILPNQNSNKYHPSCEFHIHPLTIFFSLIHLIKPSFLNIHPFSNLTHILMTHEAKKTNKTDIWKKPYNQLTHRSNKTDVIPFIIQCNSKCKSKNWIYKFTCNYCPSFYIGIPNPSKLS